MNTQGYIYYTKYYGRGGGGKKIRVRGKKSKGERKREGNYITNGEKGLKNASFWVMNFAPPAANLFVGEKMNLKRGGGGE